jgi:HlyD family secretion protein
MSFTYRMIVSTCAAAFALACGEEAPPPLYEAVAVEYRDVVVSAEAAGTIEPILVVDVKSKASGEIIELTAETGDIVRQGELLVRVDPREPQNQLAQAEADLEVARAQLTNAEAARRRADQMFAAQVLSEQEHEAANLAYANARAQLVRAERAVQTSRDQLDDTNVRAPITGTIIEKNVERGQVIASATREVSGGTVLLRMADLAEVQVRTLVDETDIGKVQPGMRATIIVDAFPNRPFEGRVLKIEPQSVTQQNVIMFPVLIRIANEQGLLRPGMSAEVEIHIGQRERVLAIPNAALRTQRDVGSAAQVLGLEPREVERTLAAADSAAPSGGAAAQAARGEAARTSPSRGPVQDLAAQAPPRGGRGGPRADSLRTGSFAGTSPGSPMGGARAGSGDSSAGGQRQRFQPPPGVSEEQMRAVFRKRMSGEPLTPQEQAILSRLRAQTGPASGSGGAAPRRRFGAGNQYQFGGSYIVFVLREGQPTPVRVRTGLTDLDYSEVVSGLSERDTVLLLPSASLVQSQQEMRERFNRITGGGGLPGMRQQNGTTGAPRQ